MPFIIFFLKAKVMEKKKRNQKIKHQHAKVCNWDATSHQTDSHYLPSDKVCYTLSTSSSQGKANPSNAEREYQI